MKSDAQSLLKDVLLKRYLEVESESDAVIQELENLDSICKTLEDTAQKFRHY